MFELAHKCVLATQYLIDGGCTMQLPNIVSANIGEKDNLLIRDASNILPPGFAASNSLGKFFIVSC